MEFEIKSFIGTFRYIFDNYFGKPVIYTTTIVDQLNEKKGILPATVSPTPK